MARQISRCSFALGAVGLLGIGLTVGPVIAQAQTTRAYDEERDRIIITPGPSTDVEPGPATSTESTGSAAVVGPSTAAAMPDREPIVESHSPRTDQLVAQARAEERERIERERDRERYRRQTGEVYVGGYGGVTLGNLSTVENIEGRGTAAGQSFGDRTLDYGGIYGIKIGYFHPGRLNWLGLELEGFNTTPHIRQQGGLPGSNLRVSALALNAIARTKLGCGNRSHDRNDPDFDPMQENHDCPLHLYAGAGLGVFFAETNNQFGRSTENARAGLNALAGVRYFFNRHVAMFAEYKFNYVDLRFDQFGGPTSGLNGTYLLNHVVGGLSVHF